MNKEIFQRTNEIVALCKAHHVRRLAIFGSVLRDDFDRQNSDIDLLVEFQPLSGINSAENYFSLLQELTRLFGRKVDLVVFGSIQNPYFLREIEASQKVLYAA